MTGTRFSGSALAQEENVGRDFRAGIALECDIGKADCTDQVGTLREIGAYGLVLLVHGVAAGNQRHDAARTQLVERLGKEIIVYGAGEISLIRRVVDGVVAERD